MEIDWKATWRNAKISAIGLFSGLTIGFSAGELYRNQFLENKYNIHSKEKADPQRDSALKADIHKFKI